MVTLKCKVHRNPRVVCVCVQLQDAESKTHFVIVVCVNSTVNFLAVLHDIITVITIKPWAFAVMEMGRKRAGNFKKIKL